MKKVLIFILFLFSFLFTSQAFAKENAFVTIINPVRGNDFWDLKDQKPETAVLGQIEILNGFNLPATWLIRFDALNDNNIINEIKNRTLDEKGLFLEITPAWTDKAKVQYRKSASWHNAASAFLTGYERAEREKLIDAAFEEFKVVFGDYPVSVGAWWIDSYSLGYMLDKYKISSALIVADQYSTDNYQIWGQYFSTPYYPAKNNALHPASSKENKLDIVMMQWASRDPVNSYGNGVEESTFSVQVNDYIDYHDLDINYFSSLIDLYTKQQFNKLAHIVVGLENSYFWNKYSSEYQKQIKTLLDKKNAGQIQIATMDDFASWYKEKFPLISPEQLIVADDPLGSFKKAVWYMNPYYRAALFINQEGVVFRDIRQYIEGEEELCFLKSCQSVNFATFATRVLDDVTYGHKWVIDEGRIKDFDVSKGSEGYLVSYINEAGNKRRIELLPRDIKVDDKVSTIDGAILDAVKQDKTPVQQNTASGNGQVKWSVVSVVLKLGGFLLFLAVVCILPGLSVTNKLYKKDTAFLQKLFLSAVTGLVLLTITFYFTSLLNIRFLLLFYILFGVLMFFKLKLMPALKLNVQGPGRLDLVSFIVIFIGTIFQAIPVFKSGLTFSYGLGFWGPNTHDGIWHVSLISQAIKSLPIDNPIFAQVPLKNYHFFYDLLVAATAYLTRLPVLDLVFRFYPVIFSLLLGIGTYYLVIRLFEERTGTVCAKIAAVFALYFVYFAGSFGWIVEYIKQKTLGGESAFWANQSISFNLNPPFAISLIIIIALLLLLVKQINRSFSGFLVCVILAGGLVGFKAYGAVLILISLFITALINIFKKDFSYLLLFIFSSSFSLLIFLSNFEPTKQLMIIAPFWFIHAMIDSPDRVGWIRLSLARTAGLESGNWFKFISAEAVSFLIFIFGNLGMRLISLFSLIKVSNIITSNIFSFILLFSILSFLIPVLFIQSGNPWNTVQFTYYGLYITAVISGVVLSRIVFRLPKAFAVIVASFVLILTPVNSITTATYYLGLPHARIGAGELEALNFLSKQQEGVVLTYPYDNKLKQKLDEPRPLLAYDSTAYVSAFSQKTVYLEDEPQNKILLTDYSKRLISSKDFFLRPIKDNIKFLQDNKIKYIYIPQIYNIKLDESSGLIKSIFENEEVVIYKTS